MTNLTLISAEDAQEFSRVLARLVRAAKAHVERAKEKHGVRSPEDCYEPTMAELWRAVIAVEEWSDE